MKLRSLLALLAAPVVAGVIPAAFYSLNPALNGIGPREWVQVGAWVVFALVFECVVLLPMARFFRARKFFRLWLVCAGAIIWLVASFAWFSIVFGVSLPEALGPSLAMGAAGLFVCGTFALLWAPSVPASAATS